MAHHVEPMDIDSDFDNKENSLHHNNVLPFTEKGYEELDVSELNMKLRYSLTPVSSPMSKSYTSSCLENRNLESGDDSLNVTVNENVSLTRSLNSTITKNDNIVKSLKGLPLQAIPKEQFSDSNRNVSVLRPLEPSVTPDNGNITVTVSGPSDIDENSMPSSSSSALHTPEATTPTKDIPPKDGGSPIMRGLKSVLNMFRSSQSPIPPADNETTVKSDILSPAEEVVTTQDTKTQSVLASTPISVHRKKEMSPTKRSSPQKDSSIVFNEDLEKELQWKDETTIIFSQERIPIHKLLLQQPQDIKPNKDMVEMLKEDIDQLNSTVEYMDISYNDSIRDRTMTDIQNDSKKLDGTCTGESDGEFVDCETTFTKNESNVAEDMDKASPADQTHDLDLTKEIEAKNESGSRLRQIILNTTQDILDATLSVRPEDYLPESPNETKDMPALIFDNTEILDMSSVTQGNQILFDQTIDIDSLLAAKSEEPYATKTIEVASTQPNDQTFDVTNLSTNMEPKKENLDVTNTIENNLNQTQVLESNPNEHLNNTVVNETITLDNKTFDVQLNSALNDDNSNSIDVTPDIPLNKVEAIESAIIAAIPGTEMPSPAPLNEHLDKPLPELDALEVLTVKEAFATELPVDIPLPDEDDLEKELNIDIASEVSISPVNLPLDLVDDIKMIAEVTNITNDVPVEGFKVNLIENLMNVQDPSLPEVSEAINIIKLESGDNIIKGKDMEINATSTATEIHDILEQSSVYHNMSAENTDEKAAGHMPETTSFPNVVANESELLVNKSMEDKVTDADTQISRTENVDPNITIDRIEQSKLPNQIVLPTDINESVVGFKPLPDIINETITMSNVDDVESLTSTLETKTEQVEIKSDNVDDKLNEPIGFNITPENFNDIVKQMSNANAKTENVELINEIQNINQENLEKVACEELPNEVTAPTIDQTTPGNMSTGSEIKESDIIPSKNILAAVKEPLDEGNKEVTENKDAVEVEEEIVLSENNSPFVSVIAENIPEDRTVTNAEDDNVEEALKPEEQIPRSNSPPIRSKGYNFNFDDMDMDLDPFATKTKIRMSPPVDSPMKTVEEPITTKAQVKTLTEKPMPKKDMNRRKSQPERKRPAAPKRKFNSSFDCTISEKVVEKSIESVETCKKEDIQLALPASIALNPNNVTIEEKKLNNTIAIQVDTEFKETLKREIEIITPESEIVKPIAEIVKTETEIMKLEPELEHVLKNNIEQPIEISTVASEPSVECNLSDPKGTSSSELSTYFSAGTSSSESSVPSKNVFNIPEIDDVNFNPFATKSKMRQSRSPSLDLENPFATKSKIRSSPDSSRVVPLEDGKPDICEDKIETEAMEKDASGNISNSTVSSKATDERNVTTREIHTEDEDTIEGPFLEAEDLNPVDKMSDFDGENVDMMQFNELPTRSNEDNLDNGELFIDAEAFEFLLNQNKSNTVIDSGKESLFLKFDPLFAKRMSAVTSDGVLASLARLQKRQSTPTKAAQTPPKSTPSPVAGPSNLNITQDIEMNVSEELNEDLNITVSKPMMVVPPAVNPVVTPRNKSITPNRSNRRSITFTSPAMAVIDRLLSLSGNNSLHDTTVTQVSREQNEADIALSQLRELLAEKEIHVYNLRSESNDLRDRLSTLEGHVRSLEAESQDRLKKINQLNSTLAEKTMINKSMAAVVEEYERTIASLISETAQDKKKHEEERIKLINERDEQTAHLASMEVSFSDLHSKYEKSKQIILNCKANEDSYKKSIKEFSENLTKMQNNYELLKQHATSKLNHANQELEKINKSHEAEVLKLNAMIKRKELHITSLEESLTQKTKANEELTAICDELINKVG